MGEDGEKTIVQNAARDEVVKALVPPEPPKPPPGCVERVLNYRDRNLLIGACRAFCTKDGHKGLMDQMKLDKLNKLLAFESTLEYFAEIDDAHEEKLLEWQRAINKYKLWRSHKAGILKAEDFRKEFPDTNPADEIPKPPLRPPDIDPQKMRGPERAFHIPSKLDVWIQDALKRSEWSTAVTEYAVELCSKFGLAIEE